MIYYLFNFIIEIDFYNLQKVLCFFLFCDHKKIKKHLSESLILFQERKKIFQII